MRLYNKELIHYNAGAKIYWPLTYKKNPQALVNPFAPQTGFLFNSNKTFPTQNINIQIHTLKVF